MIISLLFAIKVNHVLLRQTFIFLRSIRFVVRFKSGGLLMRSFQLIIFLAIAFSFSYLGNNYFNLQAVSYTGDEVKGLPKLQNALNIRASLGFNRGQLLEDLDFVHFSKGSLEKAQKNNQCWTETQEIVYLPAKGNSLDYFYELAFCLFWNIEGPEGTSVGLKYLYVGGQRPNQQLDISRFHRGYKTVGQAVHHFHAYNKSTYKEFLIVNGDDPLNMSKNEKVEVPYNISANTLKSYLALYQDYPIYFKLERPSKENGKSVKAYQAEMRQAIKTVTAVIRQKERSFKRPVSYKFGIRPANTKPTVHYSTAPILKTIFVNIPYNIPQNQLQMLLDNQLKITYPNKIKIPKQTGEHGYMTQLDLQPESDSETHFAELVAEYSRGIETVQTALIPILTQLDPSLPKYDPSLKFYPIVFSIGPTNYFPLYDYITINDFTKQFISFPNDISQEDLSIIVRFISKNIAFHCAKKIREDGLYVFEVSKEDYLETLRSIDQALSSVSAKVFKYVAEKVYFEVRSPQNHQEITFIQVVKGSKEESSWVPGDWIFIPALSSAADIKAFIEKTYQKRNPSRPNPKPKRAKIK